MNKLKLFIENFFVYGLGSVINKIIPLIMLPVITRLMPDTYYFGLNDLFNTAISFGTALAVMGMYDAMYRLFFEENGEEYKRDICSSALAFTLITSFLVFLLLFLLEKPLSVFIFSDVKYRDLLFLGAIAIFVSSTNSIVSAPTRMQNQRRTYLSINILSSVISYALAVPLLLKGKFVIALPLASVLSGLLIEIFFFRLNRKWFLFKHIKWNIIRQLLILAIPLLPNFLIYWIFNSSDRLMIAKLMGNEYTGIYAVGAKLGQCSQLIYTAFAGGWQFFAFSTMKEEKQVQNNSMIYEYMAAISFVVSILVTAFSKVLFEVAFEGDYSKGWIVSPYLFLAPLLQMLFQIASNQFIVIKKTWPNMFILSFGAITNIMINFLLIPKLGIEGAAIATLIGYIVSNVICIVLLQRMKLMILSKRFFITVSIPIIYILVWRLMFWERSVINIILAIIVCALYSCLYKKDMKQIFNYRRNR